MPTGYKHTPESIEKIKKAHLGKKRAPFSAEWREKLSASLMGNKRTLGYKHTKEWKKEASERLTGEKHPRWGMKASAETLKKISGANNWNWQGGKTPLKRKLRNSKRYADWRKKVFERDNYTCQDCKARNGNGVAVILNADHVKSFAHFPELRFELSNGRTLCLPCHRNTPTWGHRNLVIVK